MPRRPPLLVNGAAPPRTVEPWEAGRSSPTAMGLCGLVAMTTAANLSSAVRIQVAAVAGRAPVGRLGRGTRAVASLAGQLGDFSPEGRTQDVRARTTRTQGAGGAARGRIPFDDWRPHPASRPASPSTMTPVVTTSQHAAWNARSMGWPRAHGTRPPQQHQLRRVAPPARPQEVKGKVHATREERARRTEACFGL